VFFCVGLPLAVGTRGLSGVRVGVFLGGGWGIGGLFGLVFGLVFLFLGCGGGGARNFLCCVSILKYWIVKIALAHMSDFFPDTFIESRNFFPSPFCPGLPLEQFVSKLVVVISLYSSCVSSPA